MSGITCPHCEGRISKSFAIKALAMLAKSEGHDLNDELEALAAEGFEEAGLVDEADADDVEAEKAVTGRRNPVGNKTASHRGKAPGSFVAHPRTGGKQGVDRKNKPTNPVNEGGMAKSLNLPIIEGDAQIVTYSDGSDQAVAKAIETGNMHVPVARNLRAERETATGEITPE